ncbi:hypothetical protein EP7_001920 [Isosphaeraceae bacterium EP7]
MTRRLAEAIAKRYGVRFNFNDLAAWLTARGQSPQKLEVAAFERDNPAIPRWAVEDWPRLKKPWKEGAYVVLIDESGFFINPTVRRTWRHRAGRRCSPGSAGIATRSRRSRPSASPRCGDAWACTGGPTRITTSTQRRSWHSWGACCDTCGAR